MYWLGVVASSAVDCVFEPRLGQTKDYEIGICCFLHEVRSKSNLYWLPRNQNNVSEWMDTSTRVSGLALL
jgi:hypothetical protein